MKLHFYYKKVVFSLINPAVFLAGGAAYGNTPLPPSRGESLKVSEGTKMGSDKLVKRTEFSSAYPIPQTPYPMRYALFPIHVVPCAMLHAPCAMRIDKPIMF